MSVRYIDSSAVLKLLLEEEHSLALAEYYEAHAREAWVSSTLLRVEVLRATARALPSAVPAARDLLSAFGYLDIDDVVIDAAARLPGPTLRSMDAIHLATARQLGDDLSALVTYDERLSLAASEAGVVVATPAG